MLLICCGRRRLRRILTDARFAACCRLTTAWSWRGKETDFDLVNGRECGVGWGVNGRDGGDTHVSCMHDLWARRVGGRIALQEALGAIAEHVQRLVEFQRRQHHGALLPVAMV